MNLQNRRRVIESLKTKLAMHQTEYDRQLSRLEGDKQKIMTALPGLREEVWKKSGLSWSRFLYVWGLTRSERWQVGARWEKRGKVAEL